MWQASRHARCRSETAIKNRHYSNLRRVNRHAAHGPATVREPSQRVSQRSQQLKRALDDDESDDEDARPNEHGSGAADSETSEREAHVATAAAPLAPQLHPSAATISTTRIPIKKATQFPDRARRHTAVTVDAAMCPCCLQSWPPALGFSARIAAFNPSLISMTGRMPWGGGSPAEMRPLVSCREHD